MLIKSFLYGLWIGDPDRQTGMLDPVWTRTFGVNPLGGTISLGTVSDFISTSLHLLARLGSGEGDGVLSPLPQIAPVEARSSFSLFPSFTTNCTLAPRDLAGFPRSLCCSNSSGDR
jgi:hypothetical protein